MLTEEEQLASGEYIRCACWNVIKLSDSSCPYCHRFNAATTVKDCPLCGQKLKNQEQIDSLLAEIVALDAKIKELTPKP